MIKDKEGYLCLTIMGYFRNVVLHFFQQNIFQQNKALDIECVQLCKILLVSISSNKKSSKNNNLKYQEKIDSTVKQNRVSYTFLAKYDFK